MHLKKGLHFFPKCLQRFIAKLKKVLELLQQSINYHITHIRLRAVITSPVQSNTSLAVT